jgi:hypothetical protein
MLPEGALVVLLEEAFASTSAGTADQGHRPLGGVDHHQRIHRRIIIGEILLGQLKLGIDDALGTADLDPKALGGWTSGRLLRFLQFLGLLSHDVLRWLVRTHADEAWVPQNAVIRHFGEGDLRDELGLDPVRALAVGAGHFQQGLLRLERPHQIHQLFDELGVEPGPDLAGVAQATAFADAKQERTEPAPLVAVGPADDHEFLPLNAFDLQPAA